MKSFIITLIVISLSSGIGAIATFVVSVYTKSYLTYRQKLADFEKNKKRIEEELENDRKKSTGIIRDFIYLDKDRMYSICSQLFEGVVESMAMSFSRGEDKATRDKKLEERIIEASVKVQNVVLFDHIYNILEKKITPYLFVVDDCTQPNEIEIDSFIKVTGYAAFEDFARLLYFLKNFNSIGRSLAELTLTGLKRSANNASVARGSNVSNTGTVHVTNAAIEKYIQENNMSLDKKFVDNLARIIEDFYGDSTEIVLYPSQRNDSIQFRASLDENYLRIPTSSIRSLYGYAPSMQWTLVGKVTNNSIIKPSFIESKEKIDAFSDMFNRMSQVDKAFSKTIGTDYVQIAPIAVYTEHDLPVLNESGGESSV